MLKEHDLHLVRGYIEDAMQGIEGSPNLYLDVNTIVAIRIEGNECRFRELQRDDLLSILIETAKNPFAVSKPEFLKDECYQIAEKKYSSIADQAKYLDVNRRTLHSRRRNKKAQKEKENG